MAESIAVREGIFVEDGERKYLLGNKCKSCGTVFFPQVKEICLNCSHQELETIRLSTKGELHSYSRCEVPTYHFSPPYDAGYVVLPENVRIFTQLEAIEDKPFRIGMEMELVIDKLWEQDGNDIIGYRFKPV